LHNETWNILGQLQMSIDFSKVFNEEFFSRPTLVVAPELLGSILCRRLPDGSVVFAPIVEVEAYTADDPACHASRGLTRRCEVMFGPAGRSYVYFIYGMYNCLNVVTEPGGTPGAVLIRAIGIDGGDGPGKLCKALQIDRRHNDANLMDPAGELWLVEGVAPERRQIGKSSRVGISVAQDRPWRFFIKDHPQVSVKKVRVHQPKKRKSKA
jgi:DNA-3-methyladenine glycosylase